MHEAEFLESRVIRLWKLYKVKGTSTGYHKHPAKVQYAVKHLSEFAEFKGVPLLLLLNEFAHYYAFVYREVSFNKAFLRVSEFTDKVILPTADINDEDVELAYNIEESWNSMHKSVANDFPFSLKTTLLRSKIKILGNTFFEHTSDFFHFATIANFVRHNRRNYPQIHSMKEFFIHLPIAQKRGGKYYTRQYLSPIKTLNTYYKMMYGDIKPEERYDKFISLLGGNENSTGYKDVWGIKEMALGV